MKQTQRLFYAPAFQLIATWLWVLLFPLLAIGVVVGLPGLDLTTARQWWSEHPYYQGYFETVVAGLLPVLWVWMRGEQLDRYGIRKTGFLASLLLSLLLVIAVYVRSFLATGAWISHASFDARLSFPLNVWYAVWGIIANGPLEVFFFVWLVTETDHLLGSEKPMISKGLLATVLPFSLLHIITTQDIINALNVLVIFLFLGLIYTRTRNAIGPMVGWALINGMVWAFVELLYV